MTAKSTKDDIYQLVHKDLEDRKKLGMDTYGVPFTTGIEKDMLMEAYFEALDLVIYLRCALAKREL